MAWFIVSLILLGLGIAAVVLARRAQDDDTRKIVKIVGAVVIALGFFVLALNSFTIVPARNVGVVNNLGNAESTLSNGFHPIKPWVTVETVDATVQPINLDQGRGNCVTVRLANQTTGCVDVAIQWNVDQHADANQLWQKYRGNNDDVVGNIQNNVVLRELRASLTHVYSSYDPLAVLSGKAPNKTVEQLSSETLASIQAHVDRGIIVDTVRISVTHFDDTTQGKLNAYAQALADTQIATQAKLTAEQQKAANDLLAAASSNDAGVKYQNCLNLIKELATKNQLGSLPQAFTCNDSGAPVIIGQK